MDRQRWIGCVAVLACAGAMSRGMALGGPPCPGAGNCCQPHDTPGCEDAACCELVCADQPFCCDVQWDAACADLALAVCRGGCGGTPSNCCIAHLGTGCDDPGCQSRVCGRDPFCCEVAWDGTCARTATLICGVCAEACFSVLGEEVACQGDGSSFSYSVTGIDSCAGAESTFVFTAQGGAPGREICFTLALDGPGKGCPCATELCTIIPDCARPAGSPCCDLDGNGLVGAADLLLLLAAWGPCRQCNECPDIDGDCAAGIAELLLLLADWA